MTAQIAELGFDRAPDIIYKAQREYKERGPSSTRLCINSNFLKGVKWSPDGACLLTASEDNWLRVYDLAPDVLEQPALGAKGDSSSSGGWAQAPDNLPVVLYVDEGETIYDYAWYPGMLASEPATSVFAATSRGHPVHLWDAVSGQLRASYRAYNVVDEVHAAYCLTFSRDGDRLFCGFNRAICVFDVGRPGRESTQIVTHSKASPGLQGIVSCLACNPDRSGMLAAGAFSGDAGILDERTGKLLYVLQGQKGGLTQARPLPFLLQVQFSPDGNYLYTGARRDPELFCWDVRHAADVVYRMERDTGATNQRIQFDIEPCGRHLASGGSDGALRVFDLQSGEAVASYRLADDTLNGVHFHPFLPLLATASGHRRIALQPSSESDSGSDEEAAAAAHHCATAPQSCRLENAACIWRVDCHILSLEIPEATREEVPGEDAAAEAQDAEVLHMADGVDGSQDQGHLLEHNGVIDMQAAERPLEPPAEKAEEEAAVKAPPADIRRYLRATGLMEARYVRMLSSLCAETYYLNKLSKRTLFLRHRLHLVTTSHEVAGHIAREVPRSALQTMDEGDAMAASPVQATTARDELLESSQRPVPAMQALDKLKAAELKKEEEKKVLSPTEVVAQRLSMAAAAAANAAAPLANNISSFTSAAASTVSLSAVTSQLQVAAAAGHTTAVTTIAAVTAAVQSTWGDRGKSAKERLGNPTEWYVADDPVSATRYFVIQGSDSLDHWRVNLTFDPVTFEDAALGVKVHRGVYEAAKMLYERFRPMVEEHLAGSPFAKVAFVGHSLGGSLGTLLMLMFLHRGVLPRTAVSPTYTFGAPAIFCETCGPGGLTARPPVPDALRLGDGARRAAPATNECEDGTCLHAAHPPAAAAASTPQPSQQQPPQPQQRQDEPPLEAASRTLLERMGLPPGAIRNVIMHRDIVPRAFACDYTLVADLLARVSDGFREHGCLQNPGGRQVMYYFMGKMMVLQPDSDHTFVRENEGYHPMLPPGPGLYTLREPSLVASVAAETRRRLARVGSSGAAQAAKVAESAKHMAELGHRGVTHLGNIAPKPASVGRAKQGGLLALAASRAETTVVKSQAPALGPPAATLFDAVMELLNTPHPLDTLSEVGAYGPDGAISRYHNPDNYTRALGGVLRARVSGWNPLLAGAPPAAAPGGGGFASRDRQRQRLGGAGGKDGAAMTGSPLGPAVAATGALWFLPYKGTQKVHVRPGKIKDGAKFGKGSWR